jgi:hypothetical protein
MTALSAELPTTVAEILRLERAAALLCCGREDVPEPNGKNRPIAPIS